MKLEREHLVELVPRKDRTVAIYVNRRKVKARWINVHSSVKTGRTEVLMEVLHEPLSIDRGDVKSYLWSLTPCRVVGELPGSLFA